MTKTVRWTGSGRVLALVAFWMAMTMEACREPAVVKCEPSALVDSAGESGEKARVDFQWLAIRVGLDSAIRTSAGIEAHRAATSTLDRAIGRYRDSMVLEGTGVVSKSRCIDWAATWKAGRFDHAAMATALLRTLGKDSVGAIEWGGVSDSNAAPLRLRTIFTLPGRDGGAIDSAILSIEPGMVSIAPR